MSLAITNATIVVLAPHTDDGELGAGGSIAKWLEAGNDVHYVAFSACENLQVPPDPPDLLRHECAAATQSLGLDEQHLRILDFEARHLARDRQRVLDEMVTLNSSLKPDLVLVPSSHDSHQDHYVVSVEAHRAFKRTRILGYEVPWNNFHFDVSAFVTIDERHVQSKWNALTHYRSQERRSYMTHDYVQAQARFRGVQAGVEYAEAFQIIRWYL